MKYLLTLREFSWRAAKSPTLIVGPLFPICDAGYRLTLRQGQADILFGMAGSCGESVFWRRGWDSNPRYGFPHARFRGECFQPLSHLSAVVRQLILAERGSGGYDHMRGKAWLIVVRRRTIGGWQRSRRLRRRR